MPWSNNQFDGTLVIPTGATTGARIVIDGASGTITIYDASDAIVGLISPLGGFQSFGTDPNVPGLAIGAALSAGGIELSNAGPTNPSPYSQLVTWLGGDQLLTQLSGAYSVGLAFPQINMASESALGVADDYIDLQASTVYIDGRDPGKGVQDFTAITTNTATTTTAEVVGITSGSVTFKTGRAYEVLVKGLVNSTILGDIPRILVRKTNAAGQIFIDTMAGLRINAAGNNTIYYVGNKIRNATGANVTAALVVTYKREAGTGNVLIAADATNPAWIQINDIGDASFYPNANEIA